MLTGCALLFMLTLGGVSCDEEEGYRTGGPTEPPAQELVFGLEISSLSAAPGDSVTVALSVPPERERALGAVLGRLYLDPEKMDLIGEVPDSGTIVSVNESVLEEGYLRFLAVNPRGLSRRMVVLAFEVTGAGYEAGLSFTAEQVVDSAGKESRVTVAPGVTLATDLPPASAARAEVGEGIEPSGPRPLGPIYPRLLGDALVDQDIDRFDSRRVSDIVSGKSPMPPAGSDDFYAADVTRDSVIDAVDAVLLSEYVEDAPVPHPIGEWLRLLLPSPEPVVSDSQSTFLNEIELRFRDGVPNERVEFLVDSIAVSLGATVEIAELSVFTLYAIRWPPEAGINMDTVIATIKLIPEVRMAQPGGFAVPYHKAPTDNGWSGWPAGSHADEIFWYWGADRDTIGGSWGWKVSDLPLAWACQRTSDIPIAVIDGGFTPTGNLHQDLSRASVYRTAVVNGRLRIVVGMDSSGTGHGMKVAGILGAAGDNGAGLTGVTWGGDLRLYQARTVWNDLEPTYPWRDLLMLVDSAVGDGARVINLSFGFEDVGPDELSMADSLLTDILASYAFAGVEPLVVVSAGNVRIDARYVSGLSHLADPAIYSGHDRVLVVGAANRRRTLWQHDVLRGSSFGPLVQIYAPGQDIETLGVGSGTELESGTSEAAPFVAGAASLLWSFDPTLTAAEVKSYLIRGAQADSAKRALQGHLDTGLLILNVYESLKLIARERPNTPPCGMFATTREDGAAIEFWGLNETVSPVTANLMRSYQIDGSITGGSSGFGDLDHEYRSLLFVTRAAGPGTLGRVYEDSFLTGATPMVIYSAFDNFDPEIVRAMPSGSVLAALGTDAVNGMLRIPGGAIVVPDNFNEPSPAKFEVNPLAVSHDESLLAYINGTSESHAVYVTALPPGGGSVPVFDSNQDIGNLLIWDVAMSPRGDALAISAQNNGGWTYLYLFDSTIYEGLSGAYHRIIMPGAGWASFPRFTPDGDGIVFNFSDFATRDCKLWHAGFRKMQGSISVAVSQIEGTSCWESMTASSPEIVSGGSAEHIVPGRVLRGRDGN